MTICCYIHCFVRHLPQVERDSLRKTTDLFFLNLVIQFSSQNTRKDELLIFCVKVGIKTHNPNGKEKTKEELVTDITDWKENIFITLTTILAKNNVCLLYIYNTS